MNKFVRTTAITLALATSFFTALTPVHAVSTSPGAAVASLNWTGFHECKNTRGSGFKAIARGQLLDGGGDGGRYFQVRQCFTTASACDSFINRINHVIPGIEQLAYASCKPNR